MCLLDNFFVNKASLSCMLSMNDNKQYRLYISYKIGNVIAFLLWCNELHEKTGLLTPDSADKQLVNLPV